MFNMLLYYAAINYYYPESVYMIPRNEPFLLFLKVATHLWNFLNVYLAAVLFQVFLFGSGSGSRAKIMGLAYTYILLATGWYIVLVGQVLDAHTSRMQTPK